MMSKAGPVCETEKRECMCRLAGGSDAAEEQAALASLVYSSPCAVCIVDVQQDDHPIVHVNLLFERQTGYTAEEVLGKNCRFLQTRVGGKRVPSVTSVAIHRAIKLGRSWNGKLVNFHKNGTALWNQLSLVPVRTKSLKVTHYIGMQNFTRAEPHVAAAAAATAQPAALLRGSSHQCLASLHENEIKLSSMKLGKKSSSHVQLSSLNPELASTASFPVCGALNILRS
jgi:PAS domain S-box-containing protein